MQHDEDVAGVIPPEKDPPELRRPRLRPTPRERLWPDLEVEQVLAWARAHRERTGEWPTHGSGPVVEAPRETWARLDEALRLGRRGLPAGWSLAQLLARRQTVRGRSVTPRLTEDQILNWAEFHRARCDEWPTTDSGPVFDAPDETWAGIDQALISGLRGLTGDSSLAELLAWHRRRRRTGEVLFLTQEQILIWADAHYAANGKWPTQCSGPVADAPRESWRRLDNALRHGVRGLKPGSSLARLLAEHRGVRNIQALRLVTEEEILAWADAHHQRTGRWPTDASGPIREARGETWNAIDLALSRGRRGLPGGCSLPRLLAARRGVRNRVALPSFTEAQILAWMDAYHERAGRWPTDRSGRIEEAPGETWTAVHKALYHGRRGLPGGSSIVRLLAERRGVKNVMAQPPLVEEEIVGWMDDHYQRTGRWPNMDAGPVLAQPAEDWRNIDNALHNGLRGLPAGSSLARLRAKHRGVGRLRHRPQLTLEQIVAWGEEFYRRHGCWPHNKSGPIVGAPGETWGAIHVAVHYGYRGLPVGWTLARLFRERAQIPRGVMPVKRERRHLPEHQMRWPTITVEQILAWVDAHYAEMGTWPMSTSGTVSASPRETWKAVDGALKKGRRGLPGGFSLAKLLATRRGDRNKSSIPALTVEQILAWADVHRRRTGKWPKRESGPIKGAPGETWSAIDAGLRSGSRGLDPGSSLPKLLAERRQVTYHLARPRIHERQILAWADAHHARHGTWPKTPSGPVEDAPGETWGNLNNALAQGHRGLSGGTTLCKLLSLERGVETPVGPTRLSVRTILAWADSHHRRTAEWPTAGSGPIQDAPGETWEAVDRAIRRGRRGLAKGRSLAHLLAAERPGLAPEVAPEPTVHHILAWADAYHARERMWPQQDSGPIPEAPGRTWLAVDDALRYGRQGHPGGSSLAKLLKEHGRRPRRQMRPELSVEQLVAWGRTFYQRQGRWPHNKSGPVEEAPGENWNAIQTALHSGYRGLPAGWTLGRLFRDYGERQ
jgi:hypothetical protein